MNLNEFVEAAGGIYTSSVGYDRYGGSEKYNNFWRFFFDKDYGYVRSVYGGIPIENLYRNNHSIEHVVPQSVLKRRLNKAGRPENVVKGATVNPLNFMAAHAKLNSKRSSFEFDTEGDDVVDSERVPLNPAAHLQTGLDYEDEWVIPSRTQGDIARCVVYMMLLYGLNDLYEEDIAQMRRWALIDPPAPWEIAFNDWVYERERIRNPLITADLEALRNILQSPDLFNEMLTVLPPLPDRPADDLSSGLSNGYAVLVGQVESISRDTDSTPHMLFRVRSGRNSWQGSINVRSKYRVSVDPQPDVPKNNLLVYVDEDWKHPLTDILDRKAFQTGITFIEREASSGALDYIRGNLFDPTQMIVMPSEKAGNDNDLFERLEAILLSARDTDATVYAFGEPFSNGRGLHNIHMNQGSILEQHMDEDGVWQDGGLLVRFPDNRWVAVFTAFQSQCWHTDDVTGHAHEERRCSRFSQGTDDQEGVRQGGMVRIVSALVNPTNPVEAGNEQVTIINLGEMAVDLSGWHIADRLDRLEALTGSLEPGMSQVVTLSGSGALLGNSGGTITLLDADNLRVHGVSYTRDQARSEGERIIFVQ